MFGGIVESDENRMQLLECEIESLKKMIESIDERVLYLRKDRDILQKQINKIVEESKNEKECKGNG